MIGGNDDNASEGNEKVATEAYGRAALVLVESLIHGLCEKAVLSNVHAIEIVDRAQEVLSEQAAADDVAAQHASNMLCAISASLQIDLV